MSFNLRVSVLVGILAAWSSVGAIAADTVETNQVVETTEPSKSAAALLAPKAEVPSEPETPMWGEFDPGQGFLVARNENGELAISAYALVRYLNQMPASQTFTDHLGNEQTVDNREDIFSHRIILWLKGWMYDPKLIYVITFWTVNTTDQDAIFANLGYQFDPKFNLYAGIAGTPGSRSLLGSHPYWLGNDRVMADEFFRPFFGQGVYANGEVLPGLWYQAMAGNSSSALGVKASQLDRNQTYGGTIWWMPTTHEFGPRGGYGDYEMHKDVATRVGVSTAFSPEQRYNTDGDPQNTTIRLTDSLNVFNTGALAPGVTVQNVDFNIASVDAGAKWRGFFLQAEYYMRWLNEFEADGALPTDEIVDTGFYIQASCFAIPKKIEPYVATSQIYGDTGFPDSYEYLGGFNFYPFKTRDTRLNIQYIDVHHSAVSSTFGYYNGGQDGETVSVAYSLLF